MVTHILFDFFGTLVHCRGDVERTGATRTLKRLLELGYPVTAADLNTRFSASFNGLETAARSSHDEFTMDDVFRSYFDRAGETVPGEADLAALGWDFCMDWSEGVKYIDGAREFLDGLSQKYCLSVISNTNSRDLVNHHLREMGMHKYFSDVVLSIDIGRRKPCPSIFAKALDRVSGRAETSIFIGDSFEADWSGALAAGIKPVLIDPTDTWKEKADRRIRHLFELRQHLDVI